MCGDGEAKLLSLSGRLTKLPERTYEDMTWSETWSETNCFVNGAGKESPPAPSGWQQYETCSVAGRQIRVGDGCAMRDAAERTSTETERRAARVV